MDYNEAVKKRTGKRIKQLIKAEGFTQEKLAEKVDISAKYLSRVEVGKENPTLELLIKLSLGLGVDVSDIFVFEHEEESVQKLRSAINNLLKRAEPAKLKMTAKLIRAVLR